MKATSHHSAATRRTFIRGALAGGITVVRQ